MRKTLKASMTAIMLSSVALVPMATIATVATTDAAFAKSENAGGKGNGKSNGGQSKAQERSGGQSGSKSASSRGKGGGLGGLFDKLTGKENKSTRSASASGKPAKGSGMHPSELGNMNGALNANINAVLAHIRNGNTNGPVGHLAAIAVAADGAIGAQELLDQEAEFLALEDTLAAAGYTGENALDDYYAALEADPGIAPIDAIDDAALALAGDQSNLELQQALNDALAAEKYDSLDAYGDDTSGANNDDLNQAIDDLGGVERPSEEEVADATDALGAQSDAEAEILAYWNKNEDDPSVVTEEEQALLDKLYDRLEGNEGAIADAVVDPEMDEEIGEGIAECEGAEDCPDDDDLAELVE